MTQNDLKLTQKRPNHVFRPKNDPKTTPNDRVSPKIRHFKKNTLYLGNQQKATSHEPCTPAPLPKIDIPTDFLSLWGTYRPHTYFSLKTAQPESLVTGLAWMEQPSEKFQPRSMQDFKLHHITENNDQVRRFGWLEHDAENFGSQDIVLENYILRTEFLKSDHSGKHSGRWSSRITVVPSFVGVRLSLFFYVAVENGNGEIRFDEGENKFFIEKMSNLEDSTIEIIGIQEKSGFIINKFQSNIERLSSIDESIQKHLKLDKNDNFHYHVDRDIADPDTNPDLAVIQITFTTKSTEPVIFENIYTPESLNNLNSLSSEKLSERLSLQGWFS